MSKCVFCGKVFSGTPETISNVNTCKECFIGGREVAAQRLTRRLRNRVARVFAREIKRCHTEENTALVWTKRQVMEVFK